MTIVVSGHGTGPNIFQEQNRTESKINKRDDTHRGGFIAHGSKLEIENQEFTHAGTHAAGLDCASVCGTGR